MKNYIQENDSIQLIAPAGGVVGGQLYKQGSLVGVVVSSAEEGEQFTLMISGAFGSLPKATGETWSVGDDLYYDESDEEDKKLTKTAAGNIYVGAAFDAALNADTVGAILLKGVSKSAIAANVAQVTTANGSDAATTQALANSLKTTVNAILTAMKNEGSMVPDAS